MKEKTWKMAILNSENEIVSDTYLVTAETIEEAREMVWDLVIGHELVADEVDSDLYEATEIVVSKDIADRILTTKDLNDYYAYIERNGHEFTYSFPEEDIDRIDDLMDNLNYVPGVFDKDNVRRILLGE